MEKSPQRRRELQKIGQDFWARQDTRSDVRRIFADLGESDEVVAQIMNGLMRKDAYPGFKPPSDFVLTAGMVINQRRHFNPPLTRATAGGRRATPHHAQRRAEVAPPPLPVEEDPIILEGGEHITLLTVSDETCRWPIGDPCENEFHFCGRAPKKDGAGRVVSPYCEAHARKAHQPRQGPTHTKGRGTRMYL